MKTSFACLLFLIFLIDGAWGQRREIDSIESLLKNYKKDDTIRASMLTKRAMYYSSSDPEKSLELVTQNIAMSKRLKSDIHLAKSYNCMGFNYGNLGKDSLAIYWYDKAYALARKINNLTIQASALNNLAGIYTNRAEYEKSLKYRFQVLAILKRQNDPVRIGKALGNIGVTYFSQGDFTTASQYYFKALKQAQLGGAKSDEANYLQNIGLIYKNTGEYERSLSYYNKSEAIYKETGETDARGRVLGNMGALYDQMGKPEKALILYNEALAIAIEVQDKRSEASALSNIGILYNSQKQYVKAHTFFTKAKAIYDETPNANAMSVVLSELSMLYIKCSDADLVKFGIRPQQRYVLAEKTAKDALAMAKEIGSVHREMSAHENLSEIYEHQQKFGPALTSYKLYKQLNDSIINADKKAEIARNEMQLELDKKQVIATTEIQRQKAIRYGTVGGSGILLLSGLFFFISYKRRQSAKEMRKELLHQAMISDTEMKVLRLQLNPHFIFNSLNSISDYIGKNDIKTADYFLSKFAKLMRGILENSDKKEIPLSDELKMLELYMQLEASRLQDKFTYEITVSPDINAETTLIPPLILQPFVENSIWHGVAKKEGSGKIIIDVSRNNDMLQCIVEDDGVGISDNTNPVDKSYGVKITKDRVALLNKLKNTNASVNLIDVVKGTKVEVILPLYEEEP